MYLSVFLIFTPLVFLSILECFFQKKQVRIVIYLIAAFLFIFFIGLGYKIGVDWLEYFKIYNGTSSEIKNFEIGYVFINHLLYRLGIPFWVYYLFIKVSYSTTILCFFYKFTQSPTLAITLFLGILFPFVNDPLRQLIATEILMLTIILMQRTVRLPGIVIGTLFHSSFIVIALSWLHRLARRKIILISAVAILFSTLMLVIIHCMNNQNIIPTIKIYPFDIIFSKLKFYTQDAEQQNIFSAIARIVFLIYVCFSAAVRKVNKKIIGENLEKLFWTFSLMYLSFEIAFFMLPIFSQRMRIYLIPFAIVLFCNWLNSYGKNIIKTFLIVFISVYLSVSLYMFISKPIGIFYNLNKNIIINTITKENINNAKAVMKFWSHDSSVNTTPELNNFIDKYENNKNLIIPRCATSKYKAMDLLTWSHKPTFSCFIAIINLGTK